MYTTPLSTVGEAMTHLASPSSLGLTKSLNSTWPVVASSAYSFPSKCVAEASNAEAI
jgi:hypothetical protein